MTSKYEEQYNRVRRWYDRFFALDKGRQHDVPSENYVDDIYAFFQNCYHLKDWIKNDASVPVPVKKSVERWINDNQSLSLCADICNALKHLTLIPGRERSGENPEFARKEYGVKIGGGPTTINLKYEINTDSGPVDAFQLATECVKAWDSFRTKHGI